jgi:hypothetical protein
MHNNKIIWGGCVLLFLSGVTFGANIKPNGFFAVSSLHDFFDILGSSATIAAVVLAIVGLNRWKIEAGAASDHELARKMAVAILKYRMELLDLWQFADSASTQNESEHWMVDQNPHTENFYRHAIAKTKVARAELEAISLESSAIWGGIFESGFTAAFQFENVCANTIENYLHLCSKRPIEEYFWEHSEQSANMWKKFKGTEPATETSIGKRIDSILQPIKSENEKKLLRGVH